MIRLSYGILQTQQLKYMCMNAEYYLYVLCVIEGEGGEGEREEEKDIESTLIKKRKTTIFVCY